MIITIKKNCQTLVLKINKHLAKKCPTSVVATVFIVSS
jgi:hypothetical protein